MANRLIDLSGKTFGEWRVIERSKNRGKTVMWRCECSCGTIRDVSGSGLKNGTSKCCGRCKENALYGKKFGRLTALAPTDKRAACKSVIWRCECECGAIKEYPITWLLRGKVVSCGCRKAENLWAKNKPVHGKSGTPIYGVYRAMLNRCYYVKDVAYKNYGGRGIAVCDEWKKSFVNFYGWAIANGYSKELTIDRIDNNGNYEPSNCRWVTYKEQANNTRKNRFIEYNGTTLTLSQWSEKTGISQSAIERRINLRHWTIEKALTTPMRGTV